MANNPALCTVNSTSKTACVCTNGYGSLDVIFTFHIFSISLLIIFAFQNSFCDRLCSKNELPVVINAAFQGTWNCSGLSNATLLPDQSCFSSCYLRGPGLLDNRTAFCGTNGTWKFNSVAEKCTVGTFEPDSQHVYWLYRNATSWPAAFNLAQQYYYGRLVGQLVLVETQAENTLLNQIAGSTTVWLGAARNAVNVSDGVYWASTPLRQVRFFQGTYERNGSAISPYYANFNFSQPDNTGGAVAMISNGKWFDVNF
jgi:hypothetical protein